MYWLVAAAIAVGLVALGARKALTSPGGGVPWQNGWMLRVKQVYKVAGGPAIPSIAGTDGWAIKVTGVNVGQGVGFYRNGAVTSTVGQTGMQVVYFDPTDVLSYSPT
jgi:hypothetical protein